MGSRNYLINVNDMSYTDRANYKLSALAAGIDRCAIKGVGDVYSDMPELQNILVANHKDRVDLIKTRLATGWWPPSLTQRELTPALNGDLTAATALDSWLTAALAAVGTFYSCFQAVASPQLAQSKLMVLYGMSVDSTGVPLPISRIVIRKGGATGNISAQYDTEEQEIRQDVDAFFSEPQVIDPQQSFAVQVRCRNATGNPEIVHIHNFLFEKSGDIIQ